MSRKVVLASLIGCLCAGPVVANDYPTEARVQYVMECMAKYGGATYARLYQCSCSIDRIAARLSYPDFVEADTYTRGKSAMGERGGILREGAHAREQRAELETIVSESEAACFLKP